ncbi:MAG TPA: FecR domain-containing protein [Parvularculaceae bacterium]|nr:FecR domain-containing protein [Parvularculaceae bacterium]
MTEVFEFPGQSDVTRQACEWVARLDGAVLTEKEKRELRVWVSRSDFHREELSRLAEQWDQLGALAPLLETEVKETAEPARVRSANATWARVAAAALFLMLAGGGGIYFQQVHDLKETQSGNGVFATLVGEQKTLDLPDGSHVMLNTDSRVEIAFNRARREIRLLAGEAHFDVAHDKAHPFVVLAGKSAVEAVGTQFAVRLRSDEVKVIVDEGRVRVTPASTAEKAAPLLEARQQLISAGRGALINASDGAVESVDAEDIAKELAWRDGFLVFDNDPLSEVVDEVSRYTSIQIIIADPELRERPVGGSFRIGQTEAVLASLKQGFGLQVEEIEKGVFYISKDAE